MFDTKIILLRSQDIFSDSRVIKYEKWYKKNGIAYRIVGWDRKGQNLTRENTDYYTGIAGFQQGARGIVGRIKWDFFLLRYLFKHLKEYKVIHACDFDTVLPALVMKVFGKKVIFDIFDWFSDEVKTGIWFIDSLINFLEKTSVKLADLVIICEKGRLEQMKITPHKYLIIPNMPFFCNKVDTSRKDIDDHHREIRLVYVGGLVENRGLDELIDVIALFPYIKLIIAGYGSEEITDNIAEHAKLCENINFLGKVSYEKALMLMQDADILYAMYYLDNPNHRFAAPNKFYESILLRKPIITTKNTLVGNMVKENHSGFVIDEGKESLMKFFSSLTLDEIRIVTNMMVPYAKFVEDIKLQLKEYNDFVFCRFTI